MNKKQLIERRNQILTRMDELTSMEDQTEVTDQEFNDLDAELKTIDGKLDKLARVDQAKAEGQKSTGRQATPMTTKVEITGEEKPFKSPGHFLQAVRALSNPNNAAPGIAERMNRYQSEIMAATGLSVGIPSDGGFLVSEQMATEIIQRIYETGKIPGRCTRNPIGEGKNALSYPMLDESCRVDGSRQGGLLVYMSGEADTMTASQPKFKEGRLSLDKMTCLSYATDDLLEDTTALQSWYQREVPKAFGFKHDQQILRGTGAGQMLGVLNSNALVTVAKEGGQAATTLVAENIMKMYARHRDPANAIWLINQDCWTQIFQFSLTVGTGGAPLFVPPGGLSQAPYGTLFGRPIIPMEQCSTLGTVGDIILADFSTYLIIDKGNINSQSSIHVQFLTNETAFRWTYRVNGQPMYNNAMTPNQGTNTVSEFVALATRS